MSRRQCRRETRESGSERFDTQAKVGVKPFEVGGRGQKPRTQATSGWWQIPGTDSALEPPEMNGPVDTSNAVWCNWFWTSAFQNWKLVTHVVVTTKFLGICCSSQRKLTQLTQSHFIFKTPLWGPHQSPPIFSLSFESHYFLSHIPHLVHQCIFFLFCHQNIPRM